MPWFDKIFSVPAHVFRDGHLAFSGRIPAEYLVLVLMALAVAAWAAYRMVSRRVTAPQWRVLLGLRLALITVLLLDRKSTRLNSSH